MNDERDFYEDEVKVESPIIGWCSYSKEPIHENDDYVRDNHGNLYLRENFLQANLGLDGNLIDPNEEL